MKVFKMSVFIIKKIKNIFFFLIIVKYDKNLANLFKNKSIYIWKIILCDNRKRLKDTIL